MLGQVKRTTLARTLQYEPPRQSFPRWACELFSSYFPNQTTVRMGAHKTRHQWSLGLLFDGANYTILLLLRHEESNRPSLVISRCLKINDPETPLLALIVYMLLVSRTNSEEESHRSSLFNQLSIVTDVVPDPPKTPSQYSTPPRGTRSSLRTVNHDTTLNLSYIKNLLGSSVRNHWNRIPASPTLPQQSHLKLCPFDGF